jgi:hypothetical protein
MDVNGYRLDLLRRRIASYGWFLRETPCPELVQNARIRTLRPGFINGLFIVI